MDDFLAPCKQAAKKKRPSSDEGDIEADADDEPQGFIQRVVHSLADEIRIQTIQCCTTIILVLLVTAVAFLCFLFAPSLLFAIAGVSLLLCSCPRMHFLNYPLWLSIVLIIIRYFTDKPLRGLGVSIVPLQ